MQRAALHEQRHARPAPGVEARFDHHAGGGYVGVRPQLLELGHHLDRVEQRVEPLPRLRRDVDELDLAAPLGGLQPALSHLGANALGLRARLVDLVDGDDHRNARGARVIDRLFGLRLHAVIGRDDDHGDVRDAVRHERASQ